MKKSCLQLATGLFCGLALILWMGAGALAQSPTAAAEMAEISAQIQSTGAAPIIVELATDWHVDQFGDVSAASVQAAAIANAQQAVLGRMSAFDVTNVKTYQSTPQLALTVSSPAALAALSQAPEVARIQLDRIYTPALLESVPLIRADRAHDLFYTGNGQVVAVLDTGVAKNHPDLAGKVVAEACFSTTNASQLGSSLCPGGQNTTATNSGLNCAAFGCDHGTHVAGIVAGVAPEADLIAIQVFSKVGGRRGAFNSDLLLALEHVLTLKQQGLAVASVNMSLSVGFFTSACDNSALRPVIELLAAQGVATVVAAGNDGNRGAMGLPACISAAISVAASTNNDAIASLSNISSITTLYAPGVDIISAVPDTGRESFTGTSMAAPHVAGAVAIFKQAKPSTTVAEIRNVLVTTGPTITDNRSGGSITKRRLDVYAGLCALVGCDVDDFRTLLSNQPLDGTISSSADRDYYFLSGVAGDQVTIVLTRTSGTLDPFLELSDPAGVNVVVNDNGAGDSNALINGYTLLQTGRYLIVARGVGGTGEYRLHSVAAQPVVLNPIPRITSLSPDSATGRLLGSDLTVRIFGSNFMPASRAFYDGSARTVRFVSPTELVMTLPRSDLHLPWPDTDPITVRNPAPGGGTSAPATFRILRPLLGESRLLQPEAGGIIETGVKTTMVISWTAPITVTSWRTMQNMDLRLRDQHGNTAAWVRIVEREGENSVFRLLNAAEVSLSQVTTETFPLPEEGLPGINKDIVLSDTVTLHLADSAFLGADRTAIMTPTLTFGPNAVGTYNIEFRVDNEDGEVQKNDILGKITIVPPSCPAAVVGAQIDGPERGTVGTDALYTATVLPVQASQPISFTWSPEPKSGQGTATATYQWRSAGERILAVSAENCGGFGDAIKTVQIRTTEAPDLAIRKVAPSVVKAGERITYTLTVSNSGALPANNLTITDVVPAGATYVSGGVLQNGIVHWGVSQLDGYGASIQVEYVVTAAQTITNSVISVSADGNYSAASNQPVVTLIADDTANVDGVTAGSLVGDGLNIQVDAGSFANAAQLALTELAGPTYPLPEPVQPLKSFRLRSFGSLRGGQFYSVMANMNIAYVLAPLRAAEGRATALELRYWTGSTWSNEGITCATEATLLTCVVEAPFDTEFVVLETAAVRQLFLPLVTR